MENRRAFLRLAVFGLASSALAGRAEARASDAPRAASAPRPDAELIATPAGAAPWWLVAPLGAGSAIGLGWNLVRVFPAVSGAVTVNLLHDDGRAARVDLCLRDGAPRGPASSAYIDFIVMDGGDGRAPMDESLGRAVRRLAAIVGDNEHRDLDPRDLDVLAVLEPHGERVWRHAEALSTAATRLVPG
jgi:hypothetical protein